ncbi:MAG: HEPN domain-containing protein [Actinomycetota bacterium]
MPRISPAKSVTAAETKDYFAKAEEFLAAAEESLGLDRHTAATSLAVRAGINAADAITGAREGLRAAGSDHAQALPLLKRAGRDGVEAAACLGRLLPLKTRAEYDPREVSKSDAVRAVSSARQMVDIARRVIAPLG